MQVALYITGHHPTGGCILQLPGTICVVHREWL
jgi:hypothetical protein